MWQPTQTNETLHLKKQITVRKTNWCITKCFLHKLQNSKVANCCAQLKLYIKKLEMIIVKFELGCQLPFSLNWRCPLQPLPAVPSELDIEAPIVESNKPHDRFRIQLHEEQQLDESLPQTEASHSVEPEAGRHKPFFVPANNWQSTIHLWKFTSFIS